MTTTATEAHTFPAQDTAEQDTAEQAQPNKDTQACFDSLSALDEQIRVTTGGEPGSGIYQLLSTLAAQFLGVPRSAMPAKAKAKDQQQGALPESKSVRHSGL
jgi:hypothetical protein